MYQVEDFDVLRTRLRTEREALVAAAILPNLPDGDALVRVHDRPRYEEDDTLRFLNRSDTIAGTRLRRVTYDAEGATGDKVELTPSPHGAHSYWVSGHDFDAFRIGDEPDFDDTDQAFLSDFGFEPRVVDAVHMGVYRTDDTFERKPSFPA